MTYYKLPFSAQSVLLSCQHLDNPILLYHGGSGDLDERPTFASLCFCPTAQHVAYSAAEVVFMQQQLSQHLGSNRAEKPTPSSPNSTPMLGHFRSGWAGFWGYDACQILAFSGANSRGFDTKPVEQVPMAYFGYYPCVVELHEVTDEVWLHNPNSLSEEELQPWISQLTEALAQSATSSDFLRTDVDTDLRSDFRTEEKPCHSSQQPHRQSHQQPDWQPLWERQDYERAFARVHEYLSAGDCYQVNLAMPFVHQGDLRARSPLPLLKSFNAPFSAYCRLPELTLFSVSPERFIRIHDGQLQTKPIKGTSPRSSNPQQDADNRQALLNSHKNQAENVMIVDLLRNDLSRSAAPHSVRVDALFAIESHANVHHMVSTISAQLADNQTPFNAITQALPGGSITGAPKRRAMEIIQELECRPRGAYCGSLGYFDDEGHCDFNILIRTISATKDEAICWGGGGVVMDSTADDEYQEIFNKVQRILDTAW